MANWIFFITSSLVCLRFKKFKNLGLKVSTPILKRLTLFFFNNFNFSSSIDSILHSNVNSQVSDNLKVEIIENSLFNSVKDKILGVPPPI